MSKEFLTPSGGVLPIKQRTSTDNICTKDGDPYDGKYRITCLRVIDPWITKNCTRLGIIISTDSGALTSKYGDDGFEILKSCIDGVSFEDGEAVIHLKRDIYNIGLRCKDSSKTFKAALYIDKYEPGPPIIADRKAFTFFEG